MKSKKIIYLLVACVCAVWSYVFYSIFDYAVDTPVLQITNGYKEANDTIPKTTEGYTLLANYRDPFLNTKIKKPVSSGNANTVKHTTKAASKPKYDPADILFCKSVKYLGSIQNIHTKRNIAILHVEDVQYMISEGQESGGVLLLKITKDSIQVSCKAMKLYIRKS